MIDRFTYYNLEVLEKVHKDDKTTIDELFKSYNPALMISHPAFQYDKFKRPLDQVFLRVVVNCLIRFLSRISLGGFSR